MYTDPNELVDIITENWHSPPTHLFDATILPPNEPECWPHDLLNSLADLSILTAIDLDSSTGSEKFQHARDRLTDLCTSRQDQAEDYHGEQGASILQAMDAEAVITELGGREQHANQENQPLQLPPTPVFPVARMSVASGASRAPRATSIRQVFNDQGQGEREQQRQVLAQQQQQQRRRDDLFGDDEASDEDLWSRDSWLSASRHVTPDLPARFASVDSADEERCEMDSARGIGTPYSPVAATATVATAATVATVATAATAATATAATAATAPTPSPTRRIASPRARTLRDRKYRDLANELDRLEFKATRMACLEKARVVKRKMWRIEDEKEDEACEEKTAGRRKKGRFE